ncbi:hypothetical protein B0H14DRAFT_3599779 [Mycena olivaceomarginata]|nr:hypothetical protein B0H14DRAFT_3599779 [Mycena olivaceomarginata]
MDVPEADSDSGDEGDGVTLEEAIDTETVPELELPSGPGITPSDYLSVNGKWVHKQRICRLVINKDFEPNSIVRLLRVCGHANINTKPRNDTYLNPNTLFRKETFFVGDPLLMLLHTDTKVSVAVLRTTAIHQDGVSRSHILAQTIKNPAAKVKITGQIYSLTLIRKTAASNVPGPICTTAIVRSKDWLESDEEESDWAWIWNGEYLKVDSVMKGTSGSDKVTTDKFVLVSVPGVLTELINPVMVDASIRLGEQASRINSLCQSWEIDDWQLGLIAELLWGRTVENNITAKSIITMSASPTFQYVFDDGNPALLSTIPTQQLIQEHGERVNR